MKTFRVWSPFARRVAVQIAGEQYAMRRDDGDWWVADVSAEHGDVYSFVVDDHPPAPDPRSAWQPHGVHEPSRVVDHSRFDWTDNGWQPPTLESGVLYELHVGTFTGAGTFDAAIERLDHLVSLGITHVQLMPVAAFAGMRGWGYDGVAPYAPHAAYGGPDGMKRFVNACHGRGLAVLLDVVYNHLGPSGNYLWRYGPYFTDKYHTPWGSAVNLDGQYSDEVRRYFCDNARMWLCDYHVDGLRIDAIHGIFDQSAVHFLEQLAAEVAELETTLRRRLVVIAESDLNDPRVVRPVCDGGYGLHAQWSDDLHHALHAVLTDERVGYYADFGTLGDVAKALRHAFVLDGQYSTFRNRRHGRPTTGLGGHRFLGYMQTHDQVGNRPGGERSGALMSVGRQKIGAAVVLTSPFVPMLFAGEEWGATTPFPYFIDHEDAALVDAIRRGRRHEFAAFGWPSQGTPDPQAVETFERSKLDWSEIGAGPHAELLDWHRRLIALRRSRSELLDGRMDEVRVTFDESDRWMRIERGGVCLAFNVADRPRSVPLASNADYEVVLASEPGIEIDGAAATLPPDSVAVLQRSGTAA
jgi:maltooligosyltrehalose trehalohydrolase